MFIELTHYENAAKFMVAVDHIVAIGPLDTTGILPNASVLLSDGKQYPCVETYEAIKERLHEALCQSY